MQSIHSDQRIGSGQLTNCNDKNERKKETMIWRDKTTRKADLYCLRMSTERQEERERVVLGAGSGDPWAQPHTNNQAGCLQHVVLCRHAPLTFKSWKSMRKTKVFFFFVAISTVLHMRQNKILKLYGSYIFKLSNKSWCTHRYPLTV